MTLVATLGNSIQALFQRLYLTHAVVTKVVSSFYYCYLNFAINTVTKHVPKSHRTYMNKRCILWVPTSETRPIDDTADDLKTEVLHAL